MAWVWLDRAKELARGCSSPLWGEEVEADRSVAVLKGADRPRESGIIREWRGSTAMRDRDHLSGHERAHFANEAASAGAEAAASCRAEESGAEVDWGEWGWG